ncbi:hypothetical protein C8R47DRAFT_1210033 [Mycena vitilis]|nr:hypothetical protein C8R47DRAFT_1210033 [Mycena vitilis]
MSTPSTSGSGGNAADEGRFMLNWYSCTYHARNRDERNAKTRARMAQLRLQENTLPPADENARQEARQAAAQKYRSKNAEKLAQKARKARASARAAKERERQRSLRRERGRQMRDEMRDEESGCQ